MWTLDRNQVGGVIFRGVLEREVRFTTRLRDNRDPIPINKRRERKQGKEALLEPFKGAKIRVLPQARGKKILRTDLE